ncbi:hypothetical protein ACVIGB_000132 [Bradyrhizobium sp. USDA 4341]
MDATEQLFQQMIKDEGTISPFVITRVHQATSGQSLDAHGQHLGEVALDFARKGHVSRESALIDPFLTLYAPDPGSSYHAALALKTPEDMFLLIVEWSGKPDPKLDRLLDEILEKKGARLRPRRDPAGPDYSRISEVRVLRLKNEDEIAAALKDAQESVWSPSLMIRARTSYRFQGDRQWSPGNISVESEGIDRWPEFFAVLRRVLTAHDAGRVVRDGAEYATRIFPNEAGPRNDLPDYEAARLLGFSTAAADGFLPGENAEVMFRGLERFKAEADVRYLLNRDFLTGIYQHCLTQGHVAETSEFECNDMKDYVHVVERDGVVSLHLRDQNRRTRVDFTVDGDTVTSLDVWSAPISSPKDLSRLAKFDIRAGYRVETLEAPSIRLDGIRAWSSFVIGVESVAVSLDEYYSVASPAP